MNVSFRIREWLADHIPGVQYPRQTLISSTQKTPFWKHKMPIYMRVWIATMALMVMIIVGLAMGAFLLFVWAFISSIIGH